LTVEHLIGESQGGYLPAIQDALKTRYPSLAPAEIRTLADRVDERNTITACSFCNATTSRDKAPQSLSDLLAAAPEEPEALLAHIMPALVNVLAKKRATVKWKLASVRRAYELQVRPGLLPRRSEWAAGQTE
jgi:hypothetical protein